MKGVPAPDAFGSRLTGKAVGEPQPDGSIVVRGVPFFSETRPTDPTVASGDRQARGPEWLETALVKNQARSTLGHLPPLNARHSFDRPARLGKYRLTHVALAEVNPDEAPRATLFGDEIYPDASAFEQAKHYDFRSAEISPDSPDELSAVALLDAAAPFHKYPNLELSLQEAATSFRALGGDAPQTWRRGGLESHQTKEGTMPAADPKDAGAKTPTMEERLEALLAKHEESVMKKFESMIKDATGKKDDKGGEPEKSEAEKPEDKKDEKPKAEAAQSAGPNGFLPPAVSQAKGGEAFAARLEAIERENLSLKAEVGKARREKEAESFAAAAEQTLVTAGVAVTADMRADLKADAFESKAAVDRTVARIVRYEKSRPQASAHDLYGAALGGQVAGYPGMHPDKAKALEKFGARPETRDRVEELFAAWSMNRHLQSELAFADLCAGDDLLNPAIAGPRGGYSARHNVEGR